MNRTTFEDVYARYRSRVCNYDFTGDDALDDQIQHELLTMAISDFSDLCKSDLYNVDDENQAFNVKLTNREIDILALGMIRHWVEPYVYNSDALLNALNTKDFSLYSPANLLEKMTELLVKTERRLQKEINLYSFRNGEISGLTQ